MRRPFLIVLALLALTAANLDLCCKVSVCSREVPGLFSRKTVKEAVEISKRCAEEICGGECEMPVMRKNYTLSFRKPGGNASELSDAILESVPEIEKSWCVYSDGRFMGTVESKTRLEERMRAYIMNTMPIGATSGAFSGTVEIKRAYTRKRAKTTEQDMVLLLSGAMPVIYTDDDGSLIPG